jgi:hypothetical protein
MTSPDKERKRRQELDEALKGVAANTKPFGKFAMPEEAKAWALGLPDEAPRPTEAGALVPECEAHRIPKIWDNFKGWVCSECDPEAKIFALVQMKYEYRQLSTDWEMAALRSKILALTSKIEPERLPKTLGAFVQELIGRPPCKVCSAATNRISGKLICLRCGSMSEESVEGETEAPTP